MCVCVCVQRDRTVNAEGSHLALKTVCSALFMLLCIDDTVSPAVGRRVFFFFPQPFSLGRPRGREE